jgi:hypothetical protein
MTESARQFVLPETRAIAALGLFDLLATVYLIATGQAKEANPLFATLLASFGVVGFTVGKALLLAIPLSLAEYARKRSPIFVRNALRIGLLAYLLLLLFAYHQSLINLFNSAPAHLPRQ